MSRMEMSSLAIGLLGVGLSVYFYGKGRRTDEISRGFYRAIAQQADSILGELQDADEIQNPHSFDTLKTKVASIKSHVSSLTNTISTFHDTMWKTKR